METNQHFKFKELKLEIPTGFTFMSYDELVMIHSNEKKTLAYTMERNIPILIKGTLKEFETKLPLDTFFRCHYSYIINLQKIKDINLKGAFVQMQGNIKVPVSRSKLSVLKDMIASSLNGPNLNNVEK